MRSIRSIYVNDYLLGVRLCRGRWYKVYIDNKVNKFWFVRFYDISDGMFNHQYDAYKVDGSRCSVYGSLNGMYHPLCSLVQITGIEGVDLDYIKSFGISF